MSRNPLAGVIDELEIRRVQPSLRPLRSNLGCFDGLTASIMERGLLHPIVVRPSGNEFEVVAGNRRLEACKRLKMNTIPCHIVELDNKGAYEVSLIENVLHMTLSPIEEAEAFKRYVDEYGYGSISQLARKIGKSHSYVSRRISLLGLPKAVQDQLVRRRTTPSVAVELLPLDQEHRRTLMEMIVEKKVTRSEVRRIVRHQEVVHDEYVFTPHRSSKEERQHTVDRAIAKCIASLRVCMMRFDDALDSVGENEWMAREMLMQHRLVVHQEVDALLSLKRKMLRAPLA